MPVRCFYDSYAVLAYVSGRSAYRPYFEEGDGVLTKLNLLEIFYRSLEEHNVRVALEILNNFSRYAIDFGSRDIAGSMKLRLDLKRKGHDLSYADALGYFLSRKLGIKLLTGDRAFRGMDGVEYVE